jgi:hypothetical protein
MLRGRLALCVVTTVVAGGLVGAGGLAGAGDLAGAAGLVGSAAGTLVRSPAAGPAPAAEPAPLPVEAGANTYHPMVPVRFYDTRSPSPTPFGPGEVRNVQITGRAGIPATAVAVALNVTVVGPTAAGFLTVYPAGSPLPGSSNVNFVPGQVVPNMVLIGIGAGGLVSVFNAIGSTHVLVDVAGWFSGGFNPITPTRFLDTRLPGQIPLQPGEVRNIQIGGLAGVPKTAMAIAVNVTVTGPSAAGFVTVYPTGAPTPNTSSVNFGPGRTVANLVLVGLGANGRISLANSGGSTPVILDVSGWFSGGFNPVTPARLADTRLGVCGARLGQGDKRSIAITSRAAVPDGNVTAVAVNITVTNPTATGFLTVYPKGNPTPDASNLNYVRGLTVANLVTAGVGPDGAITISNSAGTADVIVDVTGWFEGTSAAQPLYDCAVVPAPAQRAPPGFQVPPGTWAVGPVPPGRYVAPGGAGCVWQRLGGFSGAPVDVLASGGGGPRTFVDILASDAGFSSAGCGTWSGYSPPGAPGAAVGDGDWVISEDLVPGVYQSSAAAPCRWEQLMGFTGAPYDDIDDGVSVGIAYVELSPNEVGFRSRGCGAWHYVGPPTE